MTKATKQQGPAWGWGRCVMTAGLLAVLDFGSVMQKRVGRRRWTVGVGVVLVGFVPVAVLSLYSLISIAPRARELTTDTLVGVESVARIRPYITDIHFAVLRGASGSPPVPLAEQLKNYEKQMGGMISAYRQGVFLEEERRLAEDLERLAREYYQIVVSLSGDRSISSERMLQADSAYSSLREASSRARDFNIRRATEAANLLERNATHALTAAKWIAGIFACVLSAGCVLLMFYSWIEAPQRRERS